MKCKHCGAEIVFDGAGWRNPGSEVARVFCMMNPSGLHEPEKDTSEIEIEDVRKLPRIIYFRHLDPEQVSFLSSFGTLLTTSGGGGKLFVSVKLDMDEVVEKIRKYHLDPSELSELEMQNLANRLAVESTIKMLKLLAEHFTSKTKLLIVPQGTYTWRFAKMFDKAYFVEHITVELVQFFGMYVGYEIESDTLVYWVPE